MIRFVSKTATALAIVTLAACASAPRETARYHSPSGPCDGLGEMFYPAPPALNPTFPASATVTREVVHRGKPGVCYTTPESVSAALEKESVG